MAGTHRPSTEEAEQKLVRLTWLVDLFSHDPMAVQEETANDHLFDRMNDFGMEHFLNSFRPLNKIRERRGPVRFEMRDIRHEAPDITLVNFAEAGRTEVDFEVRVRFEEAAPHRIRYWSPYAPLPEGVTLRPYQATDAPGCVALERLCPFESADGTRWTLDRGEHFDDYLQLMAPVDAWVAEHEGVIVGFFSCALRPMRFNEEDCYSVYQHHYRVHPEFRGGSVSVALASRVDPRRTFDGLAVVFPYSLVDPNNVHMQHMGFPPVEDVRVARLSLSVAKLASAGPASVSLQQPSVDSICELMTKTHGERTLYPTMDEAFLAERWARTSEFGHSHYHGTHDAFAALWLPEELNVLEREGEVRERRLGFVLDYGAETSDALLAVLATRARELADSPTTHITIVCDTRAEEYAALKLFADDEALLAVHTLPWITEPLQANTLYCDGVYF